MSDSEPNIFQGLPSYTAPRYTALDEEAEVRRAEARYESALTGERVGYVAPSANTVRTRVPVSLVKRTRIDADWIRRHRTTPEQQQKIADELRAIYGPGVQISFGSGL